MFMTKFRVAILAAASVLLLGGCNYLSYFQQPDDKTIVSEIQSKLFQDSTLKMRDIHVASQKGVVVLTGTVNTDLEKAAVESMVNQVSGVKQVIDQLGVSGSVASAPSPPEVAAQPPAPTERAKTFRATRPSRPVIEPESMAAAAPPTAAVPPATSDAASGPPPALPAPRPPERITIPAGTVVTVRMIDSVDSARNHPGEVFAASVENPVVVGDRVVIPRGSDVQVRLVEARSAGHMTGSSELRLELVKVSVNGTPYTVESGYYEQHGASRGKRTAETVGGGAGVGALIGAIAGRGKGAAIGAAVGAGAGTAVQAATRGQQVKVPSEAKLDFTLKAPVTVTP